jgi:hypothetical protein
MLVLVSVVVFNTLKKTNTFDVWMKVLICIQSNFSNHLEKEMEREKG